MCLFIHMGTGKGHWWLSVTPRRAWLLLVQESWRDALLPIAGYNFRLLSIPQIILSTGYERKHIPLWGPVI